MKNDTNNFARRTAAQVNAILKANGIEPKAENLGDGRSFVVKVENNIKNRFTLKKVAGFLLERDSENSKYITIKCW